MKLQLLFYTSLPLISLLIECTTNLTSRPVSTPIENPYQHIVDIPPPRGFHRTTLAANTFGSWLRTVPLKKDLQVHLYNGALKLNQDVQFAVLDIPLPKEDLQQCADAIMRLRTMYFYAAARRAPSPVSLCFYDNSRKAYCAPGTRDSLEIEHYLRRVFKACGTLSLSQQLHQCITGEPVMPGSVLIHGGSPGHAMILVDEAEDASGKKIYLVAQGYMPAQEMHIVRNYADPNINPWYSIDQQVIKTPSWTFTRTQLKKW